MVPVPQRLCRHLSYALAVLGLSGDAGGRGLGLCPHRCLGNGEMFVGAVKVLWREASRDSKCPQKLRQSPPQRLAWSQGRWCQLRKRLEQMAALPATLRGPAGTAPAIRVERLHLAPGPAPSAPAGPLREAELASRGTLLHTVRVRVWSRSRVGGRRWEGRSWPGLWTPRRTLSPWLSVAAGPGLEVCNGPGCHSEELRASR